MIQQYGSALFVGNRLQETNMDTDREITLKMNKPDKGLQKKNLAVKIFVYDALVNLKHGNDTFSDVIERLIQGKKK